MNHRNQSVSVQLAGYHATKLYYVCKIYHFYQLTTSATNMVQCELSLTVPNRNILTYLLTIRNLCQKLFKTMLQPNCCIHHLIPEKW